MLRPVTWRSWAVLAAALGAYAGLGFWLAGDAVVEQWIYKVSLLTATLAPLVFTAAYVASGNHFWRNDLGAALVRMSWGVIPLTGPFAWVLWFQHGDVSQPWLVWVELSGPALVTLAPLWLAWVFVRGDRDERNGNGGAGP